MQEYAELERKISPFLDGQVLLDREGEMQIEPLRKKFVATTREWEQTAKDADMLEEELKEEKVRLASIRDNMANAGWVADGGPIGSRWSIVAGGVPYLGSPDRGYAQVTREDGRPVGKSAAPLVWQTFSLRD